MYLNFFFYFSTIRINMQPLRRSSPSSPGVVSVSHFQRRTPVGSPLNSHHPSPILRSPLSPYIHVPGLMPTLSSSPTKSLQGSPTQHRLIRGSPALHRVSKHACI